MTFGSLGGFVGGRTDAGFTWLADMVLTIPQLPLLAVLAGILRLNSMVAVAALIGVLSWPTLMRAIRAQVLSLKERDYVEAARALDLGTPHIIFHEILPNMRSYIAINFILAMTSRRSIAGRPDLPRAGAALGHNWGVMINLAWTRGAIFFQRQPPLHPGADRWPSPCSSCRSWLTDTARSRRTSSTRGCDGAP